MASPSNLPPQLPTHRRENTGRLSGLRTRESALAVWGLIALITALHYASPPSALWAHDLLRRAYYLPIVVAAMRCGLPGGLIASAAVALLYLPHAFFHQHHLDPADGLEKLLEIILYFGVAAVAGRLSDLEYRRRLELQDALDTQQLLTHRLTRADRLAALGETVAGIAHEIKNPLHALAGTAEVVDPEIPETSPVRRMWEIHVAEIRRLQRTAETFLSFARPAPIVSEPIDLNEVAERLTALAGAQARRQHIDLALQRAPNPVLVLGDADQLAQVALNITLNAFKALGKDGGAVRVTVGRTEAGYPLPAFFRIENNGPPIPAEEQEHLFDPFHSTGGGTGLGLSISDRIVHRHGGTIELSEGDMGTAFTVRLPKIGTDN